MSGPGWPRLAARLLSAEVSTLQGRWRTQETAGTFAYRSPDSCVTLDGRGRLSQRPDVRRMLRRSFQRGDYCTAAGPVTAVQHDGRPAWRVELIPPRHKRGLLALTVDDSTGLLVKQENVTGGQLVELFDLVVDGPVDDTVFAPQIARDREAAEQAAWYDLARRRPVPTPQWFPWRRGWMDGPGLHEVEADRGRGSVGRASIGEQAPVSQWSDSAQVHRLDHGGWSWAVSSELPMSPEEARRVVEQVVDQPVSP